MQTLASLELVAELLDRSSPDGSEILRNVRVEGEERRIERADLFLLLKDEVVPDLVIDVKFVPQPKFLRQAAISSRMWATRMTLNIADRQSSKRVRPIAFIVTGSQPTQNQIETITELFMDSSEPGAALFIYTLESLAEAKRFELSGSAFTSDSSTVYGQF